MSQNLTDLLKEYLDYYFANLHFSFPGVVKEYNASTRRASIQPSLKRRAGNGQYIEFPILSDVPVRYPGTKEYTIHFPLKAGDEVEIHFSERCLDVWKDNGGDNIEDPDPRRFALSDCYCSPGLQPKDFIPATENALQIIHKSEPKGDLISQVLMDDDKVEIKYKEKAAFTIDDDHIKGKTENCKLDMEGANLVLENGTDKIKAENGNVTVEAGSKATITSGQVEITGGQFLLKGTVSPGTGPLCAIPNCLFTGAPHGGNTAQGT